DDDALELQPIERVRHRARIQPPQPAHIFADIGVAARHQISSTSRGDFEPEQQIIIVALSLRSCSVRIELRWSGVPEITRVSHAPHTPPSQECGPWMPASRTACRIDLPGGITSSRLERASSTMNPPALAASNFGVKYSTCTCSGGQPAVAASNEASI